MRLWILPALLGIGLIVAGCGSDSTNNGAQNQQAGGSGDLYNKYGGAAGVTKLVNDAAAAILADCKLNPYFTTVLIQPSQANPQGLNAQNQETQDRLLS